MALTKISTDGVKDDAVTAGKIPANAVGSSELADNAVDTAAIADQAVALSKLPHGDGSSDGKFLRANNGADPTFETVNTDLVADTSPQLGGDLDCNGNNISLDDATTISFGDNTDLQIYHSTHNIIKNAQTGKSLKILSANNNVAAVFEDNASVELYEAGSKKLETSSTGVTVTGTVAATSYTGDGSNLTGITSTTINNNADNRVITGSGTANTLEGESGLTFSGSALGVTGTTAITGNTSVGTTTQNWKFQVFGGRTTFTDPNSVYTIGLRKNSAQNSNRNVWLGASATSDNSNPDFIISDNAGTEKFRFRTSGGLTFNGDTAASNALNDYEEGIHVIQPSGTSNFSVGSSYDEAPYTKIGRLVTIRALIYVSAHSGSDYVRVSSPFQAATDTSNVRYGGNIGACMHNGVNTGDTGLVAYMSGGSNRIGFYKVNDSAGWSHLITSDLSVGAEIYFTLSFEV